jgi:hypothetical protein
MKNSNHPIDDLFREALAEHTIVPSDGARKAFLKDAAALPATGTRRKKGLIWLSGLSFLAIFGFVTWLLLPPTDRDNYLIKKEMPASIPPSPATNKLNNKPENREKAVVTSVKPIEKATTIKDNSAINTGNKPAHNDRSEKNTKLVPTEKQDHSPAVVNIEPPVSTEKTTSATIVTPEKENPVQKVQDAPEPAVSPENLSPGNPEPAESLMQDAAPELTAVIPEDSLIILSRNDSLLTLIKVQAASSGKRGHSDGKLKSTLGIYYTPEWMFNTLEGVKFVHNFGLEGVFHYGPFSIKTGAGISVSKGTNEVSIEYNDYLGAYNKLDSMDFTWNAPSNNYIPTYYLSRQDVWDSLLKIDNAKIIKRYTYLQIPLIFGYDFMESERFSFGVRVGPTMSILLKTKQLSEEYDPGNKRIIHINDISPEQISLNWQVMAGLNGAVRLNKRIKFEVEPSVRYYFNSVYEKPVNYTKPWSIGIKGGFLIDL